METLQNRKPVPLFIDRLEARRCCHCGVVSAHVVPTPGYIGGHSWTTIPLCLDRPACWRRWEAKSNGKGVARG